MELFSNSSYTELGSDLAEVTFFTCLKILSESVGKIPCYLIDSDKRRMTNHPTSYFLNVKPNPYQTPSQFFTFLEYCKNYYGNAYAYIERNKDGKIQGLYSLNPLAVQIWVDNVGLFTEHKFYYFYTNGRTGKSYYFKPEEILHFKSWITNDDGIVGKSVREILTASFEGAKSSTKFLNKLYGSELAPKAVVKFTGDLRRESQDKLLDEIMRQSNEKGRLITLPVGFDLQPLNLSLADSQFFELKKFTARQIAAAFGVNTFYLNDLEKSSYANAAAQNLQFYSSTLLYILTNYEQVLNCKLLTPKELAAGLGYKFNVQVLLRGDPTQQAEMIQKLISVGVYSVDEARHLLDRPSCEGGDVRYVNGSYVRLEDIGLAYKKGSDEVADSQE